MNQKSDGGSTPKQLNIKIENASFKKPKIEVSEKVSLKIE